MTEARQLSTVFFLSLSDLDRGRVKTLCRWWVSSDIGMVRSTIMSSARIGGPTAAAGRLREFGFVTLGIAGHLPEAMVARLTIRRTLRRFICMATSPGSVGPASSTGGAVCVLARSSPFLVSRRDHNGPISVALRKDTRVVVPGSSF